MAVTFQAKPLYFGKKKQDPKDKARDALTAALDKGGLNYKTGLTGTGLSKDGINIYVLNDSTKRYAESIIRQLTPERSATNPLQYQGYPVTVKVTGKIVAQ